jgi:hypothetical protein
MSAILELELKNIGLLAQSKIRMTKVNITAKLSFSELGSTFEKLQRLTANPDHGIEEPAQATAPIGYVRI